jgi:hypothetical protein
MISVSFPDQQLIYVTKNQIGTERIERINTIFKFEKENC